MDFRKEDLPQPYNQIAEELGVEAAVKIAKLFSGEQVYFPKYETLERPLIKRKIISEFNGANFGYLARKYNMTTRAIRDIVKPSTRKMEQMSLFDNE